jgi:hypothetical protein
MILKIALVLLNAAFMFYIFTQKQMWSNVRCSYVRDKWEIQNKIVIFRLNTNVAYNHQHSSMATCFGLFYTIFRPILIENIGLKWSRKDRNM